MKRFSTIVRYLKDKKGNIFLYFVLNLLSIAFSLVTLAMLVPFLQLLFGKEKPPKAAPAAVLSPTDITASFKYLLNALIKEHDKLFALAAICVFIIATTLLKNLFLYLSYRVMAPMRNHVMTRLRADLYSKILELPIGFFTEQRKGDIISRMSNDANEIEWSVMSTLEGLIKEPLTILFILATLV